MEFQYRQKVINIQTQNGLIQGQFARIDISTQLTDNLQLPLLPLSHATFESISKTVTAFPCNCFDISSQSVINRTLQNFIDG